MQKELKVTISETAYKMLAEVAMRYMCDMGLLVDAAIKEKLKEDCEEIEEERKAYEDAQQYYEQHASNTGSEE